MRAIAIDSFGSPEALSPHELGEPLLAPDGVRIRVAAAGVNPVDTKIREGAHAQHFPHEFPLVPGWDAAGTVAEVGPAVWDLEPGDSVVAYCRKDVVHEGTYAEQVAISRDRVAGAPGADLQVAAGLPLAGLTAYQCLHDACELADGETVVVRGASGGVGGFAVQLARIAGARVVGVASTAAEEHVRSLGAEEFVDYTAEDALERLQALLPDGAEVLVDLVGGEELGDYTKVLRAGGRVSSTLAQQAPEGLEERGVRFRYVFVRPDAAQLSGLIDLHLDGRLQIPIAASYPLEEASLAHERLEEGGLLGKVIIRVER